MYVSSICLFWDLLTILYRFYLYREEHPKALANHGDKTQLIDYGEKKPDGGNEDEWYIVEDIAK